MPDRGLARRVAEEQGMETYFTGSACRRGHNSFRYTNSGKCSECRKITDRALQTKIRRKPENVAKRALAAEIARKEKEPSPYGNGLSREEYNRRYRAVNNEMARVRAQVWRQIDPERAKKSRNESRARHPEKHRESARRRKLVRRSIEGSHTLQDREAIFAMQGGKCAICSSKFGKNNKPTVDHIVPVSRGGTDYKRNIQLVCGPCNSSKSNNDPIEYAKKKGMLL